ncbi:MAG TPA: trehalose-phosphatase [Actinomycetales bacterium]|nr:trehalose-phosphatase [Actinomycetales bacterium]
MPVGDRPVLPDDLVEALRRLGSRRPLLLAFDFDGALAPIVPRPEDARPLPGSVAAIEQLSRVDGVVTALVSGRSRADLASVSGAHPSEHLVLVGSHGSEVDDGGPAGLDDAARARLADVTAVLEGVVRGLPGAHLERKPASVVLHTRLIDDRASAAQATTTALAALEGRAGVHVTPGKEVVEASVVEAGKGAALQRLRDAYAADAVLYVGDDVTDEHAFAVLGPDDVGVKVGDGDTLARYRVADPAAVRDLLHTLVALVAT